MFSCVHWLSVAVTGLSCRLCVMSLQVVSLCWQHGLYNGILYTYNRALNDYVTPLEQLLSLLDSAVSTGKQLTYEQVS